MSRSETYSEGRVPLHTLRADIDYGFAEAKTTFGRIGVKVWINKGEIMPEGYESDRAASRLGDQDQARRRAVAATASAPHVRPAAAAATARVSAPWAGRAGASVAAPERGRASLARRSPRRSSRSPSRRRSSRSPSRRRQQAPPAEAAPAEAPPAEPAGEAPAPAAGGSADRGARPLRGAGRRVG